MNSLLRAALLTAAAYTAVFAQTITNTSPLPTGVVGAAYSSYSFTATGFGEAPTWTANGLPAGLTLSTAGILSGTPTVAGSFTVNIHAEVFSQTADKPFTLRINNPLVITTTSPLPQATRNSSYSTTIQATGGQAPFIWALAEGSSPLPNGLTLNSTTGVISGTPTVAGNYSFNLTTTDAASPAQNAVKSFALRVNEVPLLITSPAVLPRGIQVTAYSNTLTATGGVAPYTWALGQGGTGLPSGITLASDGTLSGTPSSAGTFTFRATVTDSSSFQPQALQQDFTLIINPSLSITTATLPNGIVGSAYVGGPLTYSGGQPPVSWSVQSGTFPPGLTLNTDGTITGTPTASVPYNFTVRLADSGAGSANQVRTQPLTLTIAPATLAITTTGPLTNGVVGTPLTQPFNASGGVSPYGNWTISEGSLPGGLTLNSSTGILSGTPTSAGTSSFTIRVEDAGTPAQSATASFSLTIDPQPIVITTGSPLTDGSLNSAYSQSFAAMGGVPPYGSWTVTAGSLPAGMTLTPATGILSGTPTASGTFNFTVRVQDSATPSHSGQKAFSLTIQTPLLGISSVSPLTPGTVGAAHSQILAAAGGTPPYINWSVTSGSLPPGLSLNASTGALTGTPTEPGTSGFTIQVQDSGTPRQTASKPFSLTINPATLVISTGPLPGGAVGVAYSQTFATTGGSTLQGNWSIIAGSLPDGLSLNANSGALTGTPTTPGVFNFTVQTQDFATPQQTASKPFTITISPATLTITTASPLPTATAGLAHSQLLAASSGTQPYVNWTVIAGALPTGLSLNQASGVLSGTTGATGTFNFTIQVQDSGTPQQTASKPFALTVAASGTLTITTASPLTNGTVGSSYSQTFTGANGTPPYFNWTISTGALPAELTLNPTSGVLSGTPTSPGTFNFSVQMRDSTAGVPLSASKAFTLTIDPAPLTITTATPLSVGSLGNFYLVTLAASGGIQPYQNWIITSGALPPGMILSVETGALNGIPAATGTFNFTAQVRDSAAPSHTASKSFSLLITAAPLAITTLNPLPSGTVNQAYSQTIAAAGGSTPYTFSIATGTLPPGVTLASNGLLSGTPTQIGSYTFGVNVLDAAMTVESKTFEIRINDVPIVITTTSPLPTATVNTNYSVNLTASGGAAPYGWEFVAGSLPYGFSLNSAGVLSGNTFESGTFTFNVSAMDSQERATYKVFELTVASSSPTITTSSPLPAAVANSPYSRTLAAAGGASPYYWSITAGALPPGLSMDSSGLISGTPTSPGSFGFNVELMDGVEQSDTKFFVLFVDTSTPSITTASPLPAGILSTAYNLTFAATGGTSPYTWSLQPQSTLPPGLTLASSGLLSGTPTQTGAFTFVIVATDRNNVVATKLFNMNVNATGSPLSMTTLTVPGGQVGVAYSHTLNASGGTLPYTWGVSGGNLPPGLSMSTGGILQGTPSSAGTYTFTARVTDGTSTNAFRQLSIAIGANNVLTITTASPLPIAILSQAYSQQFASTGGAGPYTWSLDVESYPLPPGLSLSSSGLLSGTPTETGTYTFDIRLRDSSERSASKSFTLQVQRAQLTVTTQALPGATLNVPYSAQLQATGGVPPYTWMLGTGSLPSGITLSSSGLLSGTPTQAGSFPFTAVVQDSDVPTDFRAAQSQVSRAFVLVVDSGGPSITTTALPGGQALASYSLNLVATGGTLPYTWGIANGSLPSGFTLTAAGQLLGVGGEPSVSTFGVRVNDAIGRSAIRQFTLVIGPRIEPGPQPLEIVTTRLIDGMVGRFYAANFSARGGSAPYRWGFSGLPGGLSGNSAGEVSGTPTAAGTFAVGVTVTDDGRNVGTATISLTIRPGQITITTERLPDGRVDEAYSSGFAATGGRPPYRFGISGGSLAPGLSLSEGGFLTGTPTQAGTYQFTVQAMDVNGERGQRDFSLTIKPPPLRITTTSLSNGIVGIAYNTTLGALGGLPPYRWSADGLPDGLSVNSSTGMISGVPTRNGTFPVTATVFDAENSSTSRPYTIEISTQLVISPTTISNMIQDVPVSVGFGVVGGRTPYSWSVLTGALPSGLSLNAEGLLSGTPTQVGDSSFSIQVRDVNGVNNSRSYSVRVVPRLVITTETAAGGQFGVAYSQSLAATGGTAPYSWSVVNGELPAGLSLNSAGSITGTPTAAGSFPFTVRAADVGDPLQTADRGYTISVALPPVSGVTINTPNNPPPASQQPVTFSIGSAYPVDITGTLTLTFAPNAVNNADDPAIQFSSGGRTVTFRIPAGQTQAVFPSANLGIQTGTTAGTITLVASLAAAGGSVPCNCELNRPIVIPRSAPVITSLRVQRTATGFNVTITGYSTSREVTQGTFRFTGGSSLQTTELTVPLTPTFNTWFQGETAAGFGGQFSLTIPFTIQGDTTAVTGLTVTLTNASGASQPSTATF